MSTTAAKKRPVRKTGVTKLTTSQKAEAVALWRTGDVTLEFLAKKFGKRPETFSRLFSRMGIKKGSEAAAAAAKIASTIESHKLTEVEETLNRIKKVKEDHYKMSTGLAQLVWAEIVRARKADLPLDKLKEVFASLKLAGEVISNSRKELYDLLGIEEADKRGDLDELPELTVRELTQGETEQLRNAASEEDALLGDAGSGMIDVESL